MTKNTCGKTVFLQTLKMFLAIAFERFLSILRKCVIPQKEFCRHIQKYLFLCDIIYRIPEAVNVSAPKVLAKSFKSVFNEVQFIVSIFLLLPTPPDKLFLPPDKSFVPS